MMMMTTALRDKVRLRRAIVSAENHYVNIPNLLLAEEDELEFERLRLIKAASTSSSSSSGTAKGFSDTDSGISNTASSSCESFQSDHHYLPNPACDVLYESFHTSTSAFDPEEDDFDIKLSLSLANLGIGITSTCSNDLPIALHNNNHVDDGGDYYENVGVVHYSNLDNINLDEIGVDFDIVEPPPAFATETNLDNEIRQLVVDSEADLEEYVGENENCENNGDDESDRDLNGNDEEDHEDNYIEETLEDIDEVLGQLISSNKTTFKESSSKDKTFGDESSSSRCLSNTNSSPKDSKSRNSDSSSSQNKRHSSNAANNSKSGRSNPESKSEHSKKKRKRERYEIRMGYPCYDLELNDDKHVFIYSLQKNKDMMEDLLGHSKLKNSFDSQRNRNHMNMKNLQDPSKPQKPDEPNPCLPIATMASADVSKAGRVLRTLILTRSPGLVRDRRQQSRTFRRCLVGAEMVDWLLAIGSASGIVKSRHQATGMWQALLEEGIIQHVTLEHPFRDKYIFYRFTIDAESDLQSLGRSWSRGLPSPDDEREADTKLSEVLAFLAQRAPDAIMRLILRKPCYERTTDDLEMIYEELLHIKALAHLSNSVKRELAGVIVFEAHPTNGTVLFHQGDEGKSWYIILKGSVNVVIRGKGTVTSLYEGDDFGKLALINDAPRAATIVLREDNCHFLRVDKDDFNRILRDVEANTVRLKEHGQDVLVLEKISANNANPYSHFKYSVMAGSPAKMLEHLLETRLDGRDRSSVASIDSTGRRASAPGDTDLFLDDFLLTHIIFMPIHQLLTELTRHCRIETSSQDREFILACKRRVVQFVHRWVTTIGDSVFEEECTHTFLQELFEEVQKESSTSGTLKDEINLMLQVMDMRRAYAEETTTAAGQKWKLPPSGQPVSLFGNTSTRNDDGTEGPIERRCTMRPSDDIIFRVYCADHTYCTLRFPLSTPAESLKHVAADKLGLKHDDLVLVELKSSGEKVVFSDTDVSIPTSLSVNGRIFISLKDHLDALTCLPEQERPTEGADYDLEIFSTRELAYHMTVLDWSLFKCVHEYELIYKTFGRHHFRKVTSNLDVFLRRFNEIQYWVATEMCLTTNLSKRVSLFRKFLKLAAYCKEYQNLNAFCAIVMGLGNVAITRMNQTWERLPSKSRKVFAEFESFIDPSRNHRAYRMALNKTAPPIIPFMPLILKDMTFTHEGNKTYSDGLVNFEKMHMLSQTIRTMRLCRSRPLTMPPPTPRNEAEIRAYIRCLRCIDNQRVLNQLSQRHEPSQRPK